MPETKEYTVYKFDELSDSAKEKARDWYRNLIESDDYQNTIDMCVEVGRKLGIDFDERTVKLMNGKTRGEPEIYWSGFSSQGDGASFLGTYRYAKGAAAALKKEWTPKDGKISKNSAELIRIAYELQDIQRRHFYKLVAVCRRAGSNFYSHSNTMSVDVEHEDDSYRDLGASEEHMVQAMRDFADWIYSCLEAENDYLYSDECVDENIEANDYTFDETGKRED